MKKTFLCDVGKFFWVLLEGQRMQILTK